MTSCRGEAAWPKAKVSRYEPIAFREGRDMPHTTARRNWREKRRAKQRAEAQRRSLAAELAREGVPWKNAFGFSDHTPAEAMIRLAQGR